MKKLAIPVAIALPPAALRAAEPMHMTPAEFGKFVCSEIVDTATVVTAAGIKPQ